MDERIWLIPLLAFFFVYGILLYRRAETFDRLYAQVPRPARWIFLDAFGLAPGSEMLRRRLRLVGLVTTVMAALMFVFVMVLITFRLH